MLLRPAIKLKTYVAFLTFILSTSTRFISGPGVRRVPVHRELQHLRPRRVDPRGPPGLLLQVQVRLRRRGHGRDSVVRERHHHQGNRKRAGHCAVIEKEIYIVA